MTRVAFAVMLKFSDLIEDFIALQDDLIQEKELCSNDETAMIDFLRQNDYAKTIIKRYESASQMRQWINSKKQELIGELEEKVKVEYFADKAKKEKQKAPPKVEEEKKEEEAPMEIIEEEPEDPPMLPPIEEDEALKAIDKEKDPEFYEAIKVSLIEAREKELSTFVSTTKRPKKKVEKQIEDDIVPENIDIGQEDQEYIANEAYRRLEIEMESTFSNVVTKGQYLIKLRIPEVFKKPESEKPGSNKMILLKRSSSQLESGEKNKPDWKNRINNWKNMQRSKGSIKSFEDLKSEIWSNGIVSILSLLQTQIEAS
jgi:hypothetical protein